MNWAANSIAIGIQVVVREIKHSGFWVAKASGPARR